MDPVAPILVAAAAFGGLWKFARTRRRMADRSAVEAAWLAAYPGDEVRESILAEDGRAALVETPWGTGLVCEGGHVARRLDRAETEVAEGGLVIRLPDLGMPRVKLRLGPVDAALWQERIESG